MASRKAPEIQTALFGPGDKVAAPLVRRGGWAWGPVDGARLVYLSFGSGVQTTALAFAAARGLIKGRLPDVAVMADTLEETHATMTHFRYMRGHNALPFPFERLEPPISLSESLRRRTSGQARGVSLPAFGSGGGQNRRQCTREFKVDLLVADQRQRLGYRPKQRIPKGSCENWIGFSTDEVVRAGAAFHPWVVNRFPLLELRWSLDDCVNFLISIGVPVPPRSKCKFCPFRTNAEWRWLQENEPDSWSEAVAVDDIIRDVPGMRQRQFLHESRVPLREADLRSDAERHGQSSILQVCEAGCGV